MKAKAVIFKSEEPPVLRSSQKSTGGGRGRAKQDGQGMIEYVLVLAIIVAVAVTAMSAVSISTSTLVNVLVENIESVTGVETPTN